MQARGERIDECFTLADEVGEWTENIHDVAQ
jgi:hypothetical protein